MKFVYYRSLASCFDLSIEKPDGEAINQLKEKAEFYFQSNELLRCEDHLLTMTEVFAIIDDLRNPSPIVFHDWIKSDIELYRVLQDKKENRTFQNRISTKKYNGHALEKQFYSFLTPFLFPILEREFAELLDEKDFEKLSFYLHYSRFLEDSKKIQLQQEVTRELRSMFSNILSEISVNESENDDLSSKKSAESWNSKSKEIELLASLDLVDTLNLLDKQFYAIRVSYIDTVKGLMTSPHITPSMYKRMSRAIGNVELNNSHKSQVESFLEKGKTKVYQKQRATYFNKALLRNPLIYLSFAVIIILVLLISPFDFTNPKTPVNNKISGLDSLSQEDVKKTNSLLAYNEDSALFQTDDMNVPVALPDFILSDNTDEIENEVALKLYESMLNDYEIQQNNFPTTCDPLEGKELIDFNYKGVDNLVQLFPNHKFINDSETDCYVLLFENLKGGDIYGGLVPSGSSIRLRMAKNWKVVFYTGKELTTFNPLKTSNNGYGNLEDSKKIDKSFTTHFCKMDYVNFRVLSKIYSVISIGKTTRLITDSNGSLEIKSQSIKVKK